MDYETALNWVNALNGYNDGQGWLGHTNWQLPSMPRVDATCSSKNTDNFGVQCTVGYAGSSNWMLPSMDDLRHLYRDLGLAAGDTGLEWPFSVGPFWRLQPGFYWACVRADNTGLNGPCDLTQHAPTPPGSIWLEDSFNFDDGFEGTDLDDKQFYVMVYFPAP